MTLTEKLNALLNIDADIEPLFQSLVDCAISLNEQSGRDEALKDLEEALDSCGLDEGGV